MPHVNQQKPWQNKSITLISECIILSLAGEIKNTFTWSRKWNIHVYIYICKKETQINVGEGDKVKKLFKDLAEREGIRMGDKSNEREKW